MGSRKRMRTSDTEVPLPEPIIHHIQSFLDAEEAFRTALISKSWYTAWLTRPNLQFDEWSFMRRCLESNIPIAGDFWSNVKKTLQRYEDSNLTVDSFELMMGEYGFESTSVAEKLIRKVLKRGVRSIRLDARLGLVLPYEVLQSETLVRLSLTCLSIDLPPDRKVSCSRVKSLKLAGMSIQDDLFSRAFPCLEDLTVSGGGPFAFKELNCASIKSLFLRHIAARLISCSLPCLEDLTLEYCHCPDLLEVLKGPRVKYLRVKDMAIKNAHFSHFPCLEDLSIERCNCFKALQISSSSLHRVILSEVKILSAKFDLPGLRMFKLSGIYSASKLPIVSFTKVLREWESVISLHIKSHCLKEPWCYQLRRFLRKLSQSKVSLSVEFLGDIYIYDEELEGKWGRRPAVDNLTLLNPSPPSTCSDVLNGFLWSCRPNFITQFWFPRSYIEDNMEANNEFVKVLYGELIQGCNQNWFVSHSLKDVNAEYFDESCAEWRPVHWETLLGVSESPKDEQKIRFQLEWCDE